MEQQSRVDGSRYSLQVEVEMGRWGDNRDGRLCGVLRWGNGGGSPRAWIVEEMRRQ